MMPTDEPNEQTLKIPGGTFYRLLPMTNDGRAIVTPDEFFCGGGRELHIGDITIGEDDLYLYGKSEEAPPPSYAEFLGQFPNFNAPPGRRYAYVVIIRRRADPICWYAIAFGLGRYLLDEMLVAVEAHRDIARSETIPREIGKPAKLRQARTKQPGVMTITTERRADKPASLADLDIDLVMDVVDQIFGAPIDAKKFGSGLAGGSGLSLRKSLSLVDLPQQVAFFEQSYQRSRDDDAIVATQPVRDPNLLQLLDAKLVEMFRDRRNGDISFSVPHFIEIDQSPILHITRSAERLPSRTISESAQYAMQSAVREHCWPSIWIF